MILTGIARLGRDAALRFTPAGDSVCNLALAFAHGKKDTGGNRPTQWVEATLWGKQAENLTPYLKKGAQISVIIQDPTIEHYTNRDGTAGAKLVGRILNVEFVGSKPESAQPAQTQAAAVAQPAQTQAATVAQQNNTNYDYDDDIPF
jgi:single-strand DNA-binding protein